MRPPLFNTGVQNSSTHRISYQTTYLRSGVSIYNTPLRTGLVTSERHTVKKKGAHFFYIYGWGSSKKIISGHLWGACASTFPTTMLCHFCQTLSVDRDPLHLFIESFLLDMIFQGIHQLCSGVYISIFYKMSFEKHSNWTYSTLLNICEGTIWTCWGWLTVQLWEVSYRSVSVVLCKQPKPTQSWPTHHSW